MFALLALVAFAAIATGCARVVANRDPVGEPFPAVTGTPLDGGTMALPGDLAGAPAILLVGYVQDAQFDLDRWILGILQAGITIRLLEVPTMEGLVPGLFAGQIDGGMKRGIPSEDWGAVVTVYEDGDRIVEFLGNERPRNGRALLLDAEGRVVWFRDNGYSAGNVLSLKSAAEQQLVDSDNEAGVVADGE
jgi:hypothetical protein